MSYRATSWGFDTGGVRDWTERASCRPGSGIDPELFHVVGRGQPSLDMIRTAKAICARCEVSAECLRLAVESGDDWGIYGGTTPEERRGRPDPTTRPRYCQRCDGPFDWDPAHPYARLCGACDRRRTADRELAEVAS